MVITYNGVENFKVQFGDTVLAFNPVSKNSKLKSSRFGADIVLVTTNHNDMNGIENTSSAGKEPFVINGPGEYEIKDILIKGYPSHSSYDKEKRLNTIYSVVLEGMHICFLGALGEEGIDSKTKEELDGIDVLFVPIGGDGVLTPQAAHKLAVSLEAKIIVPMHFGQVGEKDALKKFLKEEGSEKTKPIDKLTIKKKDLESKEGEIVIISEE